MIWQRNLTAAGKKRDLSGAALSSKLRTKGIVELTLRPLRHQYEALTITFAIADTKDDVNNM